MNTISSNQDYEYTKFDFTNNSLYLKEISKIQQKHANHHGRLPQNRNFKKNGNSDIQKEEIESMDEFSDDFEDLEDYISEKDSLEEED